MTDTTSTLYLEQILKDVHPLMAEGLYLAAVPGWYNVGLMAAMRQRDDGKDEGLVERLTRYSFIIPIQSDGEPIYSVRPDERIILQRSWIAKDPLAYRVAHERALAYWEAHPDPNPFAQAQNRLYHLLFVDQATAADYLVERFRVYHNDRQLGAIERLLDTVKEARFYLAQLNDSSLEALDELHTHLRARLAQLRGRWAESLELLKPLQTKPDLSARLRPYVPRAIGYALAQTGQYVEAMAEYRTAVSQFEQQLPTARNPAILQAEKANTLIALGDAYVELAVTARGYQEKTQPTIPGWKLLRDLFYFFLSLPLMVYLGFHLGLRVLYPSFWPVLRYLDWMIARLFASGARQYYKADPILEQYGNPAEGVTADEKLANLYLSLGDAQQAQTIFNRLLNQQDAPLGEYRKTAISVGLAQAYLRLNQPQAAQTHLEAALPSLQLYEDVALQADSHAYLAESLVAQGVADRAISHYQEALRLYQTLQDEVSATEVGERLAELGQESDIPQRYYPVRYRHPAMRLFHRATLILLAMLIFIIPVTIIRFDTSSSVVPVITFNATPLLQADQPDFRPNLSQGVVASNLVPPPNPDVTISLGFGMFAAYLVLSTAVGLLAISSTSLQQVQAATQSQAVQLTEQTLRVGEMEIVLSEVTRFIRGDVRVLNLASMDNSSFALVAPGKRLVVDGNTAEYPALRHRVETLLPATTQQQDYSYTLGRSRSGGVFFFTVGLLGLIALLGKVAPAVLLYDIPGTPYSLADLYPYFYLGIFFPAIWWFAVRPLQMRHYLRPRDRWPWWVGALGALLLVFRLLTRFYPWFTVPDIYPTLAIILLVSSLLWHIWRAWRDRQPEDSEAKQRIYPAWVVGITAVLALIALYISVSHLWREVRAYHYLVLGNSYRDRAVQLFPSTAKDDLLHQAIDAYGRALTIADERVAGFNSRAAARIPLGIPSLEQSIWFSALNSRAAMRAQLGQYEGAIEDYTTILDFSNAPDEVYASRAIAYQGLGTVVFSEEVVSADEQEFNAALADFDHAIALNPDKAAYHLWRAVALHALDSPEAALADYQTALNIEGTEALNTIERSQSYIGQGWIYYALGEFERAIELFQQAVQSDDDSTDARIGLGYANYSLRQYDEALAVWEDANARDTADPSIPLLLGTLYWRKGTIGDDPNGRPRDSCSVTALSEAERQTSAEWYEKAIEQFSRAVTLPGQEATEVAFTYRTIAQVQFLLRNCPSQNKVAVLQSAIDSYTQAIQLDPTNANYYHFRGRLEYVLWQSQPAGTGPVARVSLFQGITDQEQALALQPGNEEYQRWLDTTYETAVSGSLGRGDELFNAGNYEGALAYYELVTQNRPEVTEALFKAGLAALAAGDQAKAEAYYQQGFTQAQAAGDAALIQQAWTTLTTFVRSHREVEADNINQLFQGSGFELEQPLDATGAFALALAALSENDLEKSAELYNQGIELAAENQDINVVKTAAWAMRDYLLANPTVSERAVYWPLWEDAVTRETAVSQLSRPDLFWRYRAEFGFRLLPELFIQRPGREQEYELIFNSVIADIERAYALNPEDSQVWRDFFVDSNIGWFYLRRGDSWYEKREYGLALVDYLTAIQRIRPLSQNATNDLTDVTFKAGLTSLATGNIEQATEWYQVGIELMEQYNSDDAILGNAVRSLTDLLITNPNLAAAGGVILADLDKAR